MHELTHSGKQWTFLSNYAHVLLCLAKEPTIRLRDVAMHVGITERAVVRLVTHLEEARILKKYREGRRNRYQIMMDESLRHPLESHHSQL